VAREVLARKLTEIRLDEACVIAIDRAHLSRPAVEQHEVAGRLAFLHVTFMIDDGRADAEERQCRRSGFGRNRAGQWANEDAARLGLPPGIDDGAASIADDVVVPDPRFGVDGLADRAEQPQALARAAPYGFRAIPHECPDRRRRSVENIDAV